MAFQSPRMRVIVRVRGPRRTGRSRAISAMIALGVCLPVLAILGLALSLWIYGIPRAQDLAELRGEVARVELVRPRRGAEFGLVTLADGEVLHVRWIRAMPGAASALKVLRPGDTVIAAVEPHEIERPHHHIAWQLARGREPIFGLGDAVAPLERERGRFRSFCATVLVAGVACLGVGAAPGCRPAARPNA